MIINHMLSARAVGAYYEMAAALAVASAGARNIAWLGRDDDARIVRHMQSAGMETRAIGVVPGRRRLPGLTIAYADHPGVVVPDARLVWEETSEGWRMVDRSGSTYATGHPMRIRPPAVARRFAHAAARRPPPETVGWAPGLSGGWDDRHMTALRAGLACRLVVGGRPELTEDKARAFAGAYAPKQTTVIRDGPGALWGLLGRIDVLIETCGGGVPYAAISAMTRGIPVVAVAGTPAATMLKEHDLAGGLVVPDVPAAAEAASSLLGSGAHYSTLSRGAARTALLYEASASLYRIRELQTMHDLYASQGGH